MVVLPSFSIGESTLSHYAARIPSLEHRYLNAVLIAGRITDCHCVYISSRAPDPAIVDYYVSITPAAGRDSLRSRLTLVDIDDGTVRSVASKLLDHPERIEAIRSMIGGRPALIEGWNVTEMEVRLALALGVPINGTRPGLRHLGFKSDGRRLIRRAGVPVPEGSEDVRSTDDVIEAVEALRASRPTLGGIVDQARRQRRRRRQRVIDLGPMGTAADPRSWLRDQIEGLPDWYRDDLARGGIVEERIAGDRFTQPERPGRHPARRPGRRPGDPRAGARWRVARRCTSAAASRPIRHTPRELAEHAAAIGEELAREGAIGRFSVDFVAAADRGAGDWRVYALEINLRKGGTTHPYAALRNVAPGRYDTGAGRWITEDGGSRCYSATDNLVDPAWLGLSPAAVIAVVADAGLQFDPEAGTGVVLHMLSGLAIDGRFGLTAIGETPEEAAADARGDPDRGCGAGLTVR